LEGIYLMKSKERKDQTAEFFTPMSLVEDVITKVNTITQEGKFEDATYSVLDPACGNGQLIMGILFKKLQAYVDNVTELSETPKNITSETMYDLKMDALEETFGVDIMASNIADLVARIVFWKTWNINIFEPSGFPSAELTLPEYKNDDSVYWLKEHVSNGNRYSRTYEYDGEKVTVRNRKKCWWLMEYYIHGHHAKCYSGGGFCNNFVVADGLKYDYNFDGKEPTLVTEKEKIVTEETVRKVDQAALNDTILS